MLATVARYVFAERDCLGGGCKEDGAKKRLGKAPPGSVPCLCPRGVMNERVFSRGLLSLESECQILLLGQKKE